MCACVHAQPANVFLDADLHAKLGDIGLAVMDTLHTGSPGEREGRALRRGLGAAPSLIDVGTACASASLLVAALTSLTWQPSCRSGDAEAERRR